MYIQKTGGVCPLHFHAPIYFIPYTEREKGRQTRNSTIIVVLKKVTRSKI